GWASWRQRVLRDWARRIDAVVHLDADDAVLAHRIKERVQEHMVKYLPDDQIRQFNDRYRVAFDRVITELTTNGRPGVMHIGTDHGNSARTAAFLLSSLGKLRDGY